MSERKKYTRKLKKQTLSSIYANCVKQSDCRIWEGAVGRCGHPIAHSQEKQVAKGGGAGGSTISGRRLVWKMKHGEMPSAPIRMTCGNRLCLFASHMVLSTPAEIGAIARASGAFKTTRHMIASRLNGRRGAKLAIADCIAIERAVRAFGDRRSSAKSEAVSALAGKYGVSTQRIYQVARGNYAAPAVNSSVWAMAA